MDPRPHSRSAESGQAIVEAAFMLPMMIFFILCTLQLTLMQQARIMVEYAAFNAARVGVVHNMNNGTGGAGYSVGQATMPNAAIYSILPAYGRTDNMGYLTSTLATFIAEDTVMSHAGVPLIKVGVLNPHAADFTKYGTQLNNKEIDFDDMRPDAAAANLLSIQVRYLYQLRVPFANQMISAIWLSSQVGLLSHWTGPMATNAGIDSNTSGNAVAVSQAFGMGIGTIDDGMPGGLNVSKLAALAELGTFYMPVNAWYSMRMQSNPYLQWAAP